MPSQHRTNCDADRSHRTSTVPASRVVRNGKERVLLGEYTITALSPSQGIVVDTRLDGSKSSLLWVQHSVLFVYLMRSAGLLACCLSTVPAVEAWVASGLPQTPVRFRSTTLSRVNISPQAVFSGIVEEIGEVKRLELKKGLKLWDGRYEA
eukprot:6194851-Pleurochrysis_carterae.AAC.1